MTTATRTRKSPNSVPEVDLPPISQADQPPVTHDQQPHYASVVVTTRYHDPQTGRTFAIHIADLSLPAVELLCDEWERAGYVPCQAPDVPSYAERAQQSNNYAKERHEATRAGQRQRASKEEALRLPFGKYKGDLLASVEDNDPDYVDWLAENANFADIRKAAQKLVNQRDDADVPF